VNSTLDTTLALNRYGCMLMLSCYLSSRKQVHTMTFSAVHHISLNVADTAQALAFYVDVLNFKQIPRPDLGFDGAWLQIGDQQLHLLEVSKHKAPVGQHFALRVDDIEAARVHLQSKNVEVSNASEMSGICLQCFFKDPSGNLLELNQPLTV
jgi:glyoxylase I family protein